MTTATRTFDCPWCGAIAPVPTDHLGEHLTCTECGKATKLTAKNTSSLRPTETPPDAPHLTGDRSFDCPWCGAISSVPTSHLGDRFSCPECLKDTKLTPTNTQRAPVTAPPPDAPHVEAGRGRGVWIGLGLLVAAAVGTFAFLPKSEVASTPATGLGSARATPGVEPHRDGGTPPMAPGGVAPGAAPTVPSAAPDAAQGPASRSTWPDPPPTVPGPIPDAAAHPPYPAGPYVDPSEGAAGKAARLHDELERTVGAKRALEDALAAISTWSALHAESLAAFEELPALEEVVGEADRLRAAKQLVPDPEKATPAQVQAFNAAMAGFLAAVPARAQVGARALGFLRGDLYGREVAGLTSWQELHFFGPGFQRAAAVMLAADKAIATPVPENLTRAEAAARTALQAATSGGDSR